MRLPPIRFVISLLLLLGVLNAVLFGTMSLVLWGAVRDSPDAERLSAVRSFDATFSGAHGSALETTAQAAPVLDGVFERLVSAEATLAPIGTDAEPVIDELRTYVRSLKDWNAALESHPSVVPPTGDIRRGGLRVSAQALRLIQYTRPP